MEEDFGEFTVIMEKFENLSDYFNDTIMDNNQETETDDYTKKYAEDEINYDNSLLKLPLKTPKNLNRKKINMMLEESESI